MNFASIAATMMENGGASSLFTINGNHLVTFATNDKLSRFSTHTNYLLKVSTNAKIYKTLVQLQYIQEYICTSHGFRLFHSLTLSFNVDLMPKTHTMESNTTLFPF